MDRSGGIRLPVGRCLDKLDEVAAGVVEHGHPDVAGGSGGLHELDSHGRGDGLNSASRSSTWKEAKGMPSATSAILNGGTAV